MQRLNIAMFGYFEGEEFAVGEGQYKPDCMWDFGPKRAVIDLGGDYAGDGELESQEEEENDEGDSSGVKSPLSKDSSSEKAEESSDVEEEGEDSEIGEEDSASGPANHFSVLRGSGTGVYAMPGGQTTPCLSARCRQYLRSISGSIDISGSDSLSATVRSDVVGMLEACKSEDFIG
jgi:hypothetical protein